MTKDKDPADKNNVNYKLKIGEVVQIIDPETNKHQYDGKIKEILKHGAKIQIKDSNIIEIWPFDWLKPLK